LVVGSGVGGLAAAIALASQGMAVTVLERGSVPGGKLAPTLLAGQPQDAGPTVLTLRSVFDALFDLAGQRLDDHLQLTPLATLARHAWPDGSRLDLHADLEAACAAMGEFGSARAARDYRAFCARSQAMHAVLDAPYMRSQRPNPLSLAWRCGLAGLPALLRISPFQTLWNELAGSFEDVRLRQLFARYATYGGSSPLAAPATLMLIAHVERSGVWTVAGGMHRLAQALVRLARSLGVQFLLDAEVTGLTLTQGTVAGLRWRGPGQADATPLAARAVVFNGDVAALADGLLGEPARRAVPPQPLQQRSFSALTWDLRARVQDFPLLHHTVFFSADYPAEFDDLVTRRQLPRQPTVYVCAHERLGEAGLPPGGDADEGLLCLVNAPAGRPGDPHCHALSDKEIAACETRTFHHLAALGLSLAPSPSAWQRCAPSHWAARFPATGGGLYGQATHGWQASFSRPAARSRLPGLYLAGGSTHPGAGLPMAALSGLLAAQQILADRAGRTSIMSCPPVATPGGTWMR
jgi:1-hydroxycarotenoid 3,4-desaturase